MTEPQFKSEVPPMSQGKTSGDTPKEGQPELASGDRGPQLTEQERMLGAQIAAMAQVTVTEGQSQQQQHGTAGGTNSSELPRPPPPDIGEVTHFSVELVWETALKEATQACRGRGVVKVKLQAKDDNRGHRGEWRTCYTGMAKKFLVTDLSPKSQYQFRYQFLQKGNSSDWSASTTIDTNREPLYGENLHMAIRKQNVQELEDVLKSREVSPDVQNADGFTALMAAAKRPFLEAMEVLIAYGADVNYKNTAGKTAMMIACTASQLDSVKLLRSHGADFHLYDNGGCTAVHWAVDSGNTSLLEWMADNGADINIKDRSHGGWTPLIRCALMQGFREVGLALMMKGADTEMTDNNGNTALHHAVARQHFELIKVLVKRRSNPLAVNKEGNTPWKIACSMTDDRRGIVPLMQKYVDELQAQRKAASLKDAKANALQISSSIKTSEAQSVIFPVK